MPERLFYEIPAPTRFMARLRMPKSVAAGYNFFSRWWCRHLLLLPVLLCCRPGTAFATEPDSNLVLTFNFNNQNFNEANNQVQTKPVGLMLVEDRFGNSRSAVYMNGHLNSYLNLGTSPLLKAATTTISLWVNLSIRVYAGRGYDSNPVYAVKNGPGDDFIVAYAIIYDCVSNRFWACSSKDSVTEAIVNTVNPVTFNKWYHLAITSNNRQLSFYVNGKLQGRSVKDFETVFLSGDSVLLGASGSKKNERYARGSVDDIQIFHRVLSDAEILDLYQAPDPNRVRVMRKLIFKWLGIAAAVFVTSGALVWRRRRALRNAAAALDQKRRMHELEIRTLKAQMNPHFIFNALNSIQQLVMSGENAKAELYLSKFSMLIRELLETNTRESLTIREEQSILNGYLEMEALRFGDSFSYRVTVDPDIDQEHTFIPHMMVQPFAENAVWHGLLPKTGDRRLHISFMANGGRSVCCRVQDNGVGRAASSTKSSTFKKQSLALSFVRQRLELLEKALHISCGVEIVDRLNEQGGAGGTTVTVVLPILNT
jgi:two-component sensor histidine kinase